MGNFRGGLIFVDFVDGPAAKRTNIKSCGILLNLMPSK